MGGGEPNQVQTKRWFTDSLARKFATTLADLSMEMTDRTSKYKQGDFISKTMASISQDNESPVPSIDATRIALSDSKMALRMPNRIEDTFILITLPPTRLPLSFLMRSIFELPKCLMSRDLNKKFIGDLPNGPSNKHNLLRGLIVVTGLKQGNQPFPPAIY
ncbi:conserved hypothetical protein [Ricinus communis]|uniref:Uncharacterized protein n=1 Tax=Ricinus communis TaxID=3988 RepID=B9SWA0_RICCO|nr:conserved hypothetical protein [Ricinus communis]